MDSITKHNIIKQISDSKIEFVQIDAPDINGLWRNIICDVDFFT